MLESKIMWQWLYAGRWIDCEPQNQKVLDEDERAPSMDRLYMTNGVGELWGCPSLNDMTFRVHGDDEEIPTKIRRGHSPGDLPLYYILTRGHQRYLPYEACRILFEEKNMQEGMCQVRPRMEYAEVQVGTETFVAKNGVLYQKLNNKLRKRRWAHSKMSRWEANKCNKCRYVWEFKGKFRYERMTDAVEEVAKNYKKYGFDREARDYLRISFKQFDPTEDSTEYGPFQFPDFLQALAEQSDDSNKTEWIMKLAHCVQDVYSKNNSDEWRRFDPFTNAAIEADREFGRPVSVFKSGDHVYVLLFDSGAGASGAPPVVLRPGRYERFLSSIEEQFARSCFSDLFELLREHSINPSTFLMSSINQDSFEEVVNVMCPASIRDRVRELMTRLNNPNSSVSMRIQNFLPALLDKFNECEIRLSANPNSTKVYLDPRVQETLKEDGLHSEKHEFDDLIAYIYSTNSWHLDGVPSNGLTCDICLDDTKPVLGGHCGSHRACLQCWVESMVQKDMQCPFCRQPVTEKVLKMAKAESEEAVVTKGVKRKRQQSFDTMEEILDQIHQVKMYKDVTLGTRKTMRKWLTIFLRTSLIKLGRRNSPSINEEQPKTLSAAVRDFRLLTQ